MRIYDDKNDRVLKSVTIYLTPNEGHQLADFTRDLYEHPEHHHAHVSSMDFSSEVTIAVYTRDNLEQFDAKSREMLRSEFE